MKIRDLARREGISQNRTAMRLLRRDAGLAPVRDDAGRATAWTELRTCGDAAEPIGLSFRDVVWAADGGSTSFALDLAEPGEPVRTLHFPGD